MNLRCSGKSLSGSGPKPRNTVPKPVPMVLKHKCPTGVSPGGIYPNGNILEDETAKLLSRRPCHWGESENHSSNKPPVPSSNPKAGGADVSDDYIHNLQQQIYFLELEVEHLKSKGTCSTATVVQGKQALDVKFIEFKSIFDELKEKSSKKILEMKKENENIQKQLNEKISKLVTLKNELEMAQRDRDNVIIQYNTLKQSIEKIKLEYQYRLDDKEREYQDLLERYNNLNTNLTQISTEYNVYI